MAAENLRELFVEELRDAYDAEKQLTKALPKMVKSAENPELRSAFEDHLEITKAHIDRCEEVFKLMGVPSRGKPCEGIKGIIKENDEATADLEGSTLDAALVAGAQKVEHYEIATYGTLATFAEVLDLQEVKDLLGQTLEEEKDADQKLTQIAESAINWEAGNEESEESDEEEATEAMAASPRAASSRSKTSSGGNSVRRQMSSSSRSKKR